MSTTEKVVISKEVALARRMTKQLLRVYALGEELPDTKERKVFLYELNRARMALRAVRNKLGDGTAYMEVE